MIRNALESIGGIGIFPVISLVLFVLVFAGMLALVARMRHAHLLHMSHLPLVDDQQGPEEGETRP